LCLKDNKSITNEGLKLMTGLTILDLTTNERITDTGISSLTSLTELRLHSNNLSGTGLKLLTRLRSLSVSYVWVGDGYITQLTNLTMLDLYGNRRITDNGIMGLINLKLLRFNSDVNISDNGINRLTNLTTVSFVSHGKVTVPSLKKLPNLFRFQERMSYRYS
jgi:hypothetical protein